MDLPTLYGALFGGAISLFTSLAVLWLRAHLEEEQRQKSKRELDVNHARTAVKKLMQTANISLNDDLFLSQNLKLTTDDRGQPLNIDPALQLKPMVSRDNHVPFLNFDEMKFIDRVDAGHLSVEVELIQNRISNNIAGLKKFLTLRLDYDEWAIKAVELSDKPDGTLIHGEFKGKAAQLATVKVGRLNSMLASVVENISEDSDKIKSVVEEVAKAARVKFPDELGKLDIRWEQH